MSSNEKSRLMRIRAQKKKHQPKFVRVESWRYVRVPASWRKPIGINSKTREHRKSGVKMPRVGYMVPAAVRGLHPSGYTDNLVITVAELEKLDPKVDGIRIARCLGGRKRLALVEACREKGFKILNISVDREAVEAEVMAEEAPITEEKSMKQKHIESIREKQAQGENAEGTEKADEETSANPQ